MEESYKTWLEFGKLNLALTIDASLKKVNDMSHHVFTESAKQFTILKNEEFSELQKQKELNAELVEYLKLARTDMVKLGMDPGHNHVHKISSAIKRVESLIKKSQSA